MVRQSSFPAFVDHSFQASLSLCEEAARRPICRWTWRVAAGISRFGTTFDYALAFSGDGVEDVESPELIGRLCSFVCAEERRGEMGVVLRGEEER